VKKKKGPLHTLNKKNSKILNQIGVCFDSK